MKHRQMLFALVILAILCLSPFGGAEAKEFRNAYLSFQIPDHWNCSLEGTEWVCTSQLSGPKKDAIIILTAKEAGPADGLPQFESYLKSPKQVPDGQGQPKMSEVKMVRQYSINTHPWVEGFHYGSEITTYYTRYLATVKDRLAILVTFSAHKDAYAKFANDFLNAIGSLRVVATPDLLSGSTARPMGIKPSSTGGILETPLDGLPMEEAPSSKDNSGVLIGLLILVVGIAFYILSKKPKKKSKSRSSKGGPPSSGSTGNPKSSHPKSMPPPGPNKPH